MNALSRTACAVALGLFAAACANVPGETTLSHKQQGEVRDRLLSMARGGTPPCRDPKVTGTEILDVHSDGRSSQELWTLDRCGTRARYVVSFPVKPGPANQFSVREER